MVHCIGTCICVLLSLFVLQLTAHGDKVNVHLIPHTHDDVGWLKTVDEYFYGGRRNLQDGSVQYILDTVMDELGKNPDRKFIYVEMAFFYRWWNEQTDEMKDKVRSFVKNGQFEFINGGWCMNDEATAHYNGMIDQMTLGLRFIENNFGPDARPTIGWQIDPFGHSKEQASIFPRLLVQTYQPHVSQTSHIPWEGRLETMVNMIVLINDMGFNAFFFWRFDYNDKEIRVNTSELELIWRGSASLRRPVADIFTSILFTGYSPPEGFCFDEKCEDDPIQDDPNLYGYNVDERVKEFTEIVFKQARHYRTNNILIPMGSDFQYSDAVMWFKNLDKLINYVNQKNSSVNLMYSTPSLYVDYVHKSDLVWSVKSDDFLPNADDPYDFWTGFYTSRPALKGYVRTSNNLLQICKQLEAIQNNLKPNQKPSSATMKMAVAVAQHHDAVAGTERQHVADDYAKRLHIGEVECREVVSSALNSMLTEADENKMDFSFCEYLNISACPSSESGNFNLVAYNPLGKAYPWYLRFPVNTTDISVIGPDGKTVPVQIIPVSNATDIVRGNLSQAPYEAVFSLYNSPIPAMGYALYAVSRKSTGSTKLSHTEYRGRLFMMENVVISSNYYKVEFSGSTGRIQKITNLKSGISASVDQQFFWYNSSTGNNINSTQKSGAYIFRPNSSEVFPVNSEKNNYAEIVNVYHGDVVSIVEQKFSPWVTQVVKLYNSSPAIEFEYTIGPIPFKDGLGKEIISRFDTDIESESTFYTDSNGREMQERIRNHRPTWKYNNTAPIAGNYYPVNSRIFIRDEATGKRQFTVMTDRSQGGSSIYDGSIELMVHRRILYDDNRGVVEPLNETGQYGEGLIIRGKHVVILDDLKSSTYLHRMIGEGMMLEPQIAFAVSSKSFVDIKNNYNLMQSALSKDLPDNVHLLTLEFLEINKFLLRLEHQFEASDLVLNTDVTLSLRDLFRMFTIVNVTELALGANVALADMTRLTWKTKEANSSDTEGSMYRHFPVVPPTFDVVLSPMQIRTFNVTVIEV